MATTNMFHNLHTFDSIRSPASQRASRSYCELSPPLRVLRQYKSTWLDCWLLGYLRWLVDDNWLLQCELGGGHHHIFKHIQLKSNSNIPQNQFKFSNQTNSIRFADSQPHVPSLGITYSVQKASQAVSHSVSQPASQPVTTALWAILIE